MNAAQFELDRNPQRLLYDMRGVCQVTGFHRSTIRRKFEAGTFPTPRVHENHYYWLRQDLLDWIEALPVATEPLAGNR